MPVRFRCSSCERILSTASRKAGKETTCPACFATVTVRPLDTFDAGEDSELDQVGRRTLVKVVAESRATAVLTPANISPRARPKSPRVFVADALTMKPEPRPAGLGRRVFAWLAAVLVLGTLALAIYWNLKRSEKTAARRAAIEESGLTRQQF